MLKTQQAEFNKFLSFVQDQKQFAIARFADGERLFIEGRAAQGIDGWRSPSRISKLGADLRQALLLAAETGCYVGISDDNNDPSSKLFYANILSKAPAETVTLSNVFVNGTYSDFIEKLLPLLLSQEITIICSHKCRAIDQSLSSEKIKFVYAPSDCHSFWERSSERWLQHLKRLATEVHNHIFLFAAGPISSATIPLLWSLNTKNTYIDLGSALDPLLHGKITRPYQLSGTADRSQLSSLHIQDDINEDPEEGVTCIVNCYKRWDGLLDIIDALKGQTKRPKGIHVLFNTIPPAHLVDILRSQDLVVNVVISEENLGVWNRFAYAFNCKTRYICIFDDDTVPGYRWIENCMTSMEIREGLYGTVGLKLFSEDCYMNHVRLGWPSANERIEEVDLVGHCWFFKRDWLSYYWRDMPPSQGFDFMGEDMHMSFAIQKYLGIRTYVPPHPSNDKSLWGSIASSRGVDLNAISMTGKASRMDFAVRRLCSMGWKLQFLKKQFIQTGGP